jgi:hypothetical protein
MSADEFIEQYGRIEMLKIMKAEGESEEGAADILSKGSMNRNASGPRMSSGVTSIKEMKTMFGESLMKNMKTYDKIDTTRNSIRTARN